MSEPPRDLPKELALIGGVVVLTLFQAWIMWMGGGAWLTAWLRSFS